VENDKKCENDEKMVKIAGNFTAMRGGGNAP
jgi:hypothetical protein